MSAHISIAELVPCYLAGPDPRGVFTKQWAVRVIVAGRLRAQAHRGKGRKASRRMFATRQVASVRALMPANSF